MTWMGWQGYETPIKAGTFLKDNDIDFQPTFIASNEEIISKLQAGGIGKTDHHHHVFRLSAADGGWRPARADRSGARSRNSAISFRNSPAMRRSARTASSMACRGTGAHCRLMYDPAAVPAAPESWMDLMKPEFTGKVAMVDDPLGNLLIWGTVVTGKPMGTLLTREEMKKVIDTLIEIKKKQARAFFASYGDMADAFARNEVTASAIGWEAVAVWAKAKGKEIKYTIPKEGTGMFMDCLCIPKDCPHLDLTYKMINHIISPEPQKIFATEQSAGITNLKTVPMLPPELAQSYNYADLDGFMKKARLQPVPPTEYDGTIATYDDFLAEYQRLQKA